MKKTLAVINAVAGFALIIILVLVFSLDLHYSGSKFPDSADLGFSWSYSDGSPADLMELRTDCNAMTARFSGKANRTRNLCFLSRNVTFRVMVDNEEIYDFHPALGSYYGYGYGADDEKDDRTKLEKTLDSLMFWKKKKHHHHSQDKKAGEDVKEA